MTNEMKLLQALCEALGFEVETTLDYQERKESKEAAMKINTLPVGGNPERVLATIGNGVMLDIDEGEIYTSLLINPIVDYKLHKRNDGLSYDE